MSYEDIEPQKLTVEELERIAYIAMDDRTFRLLAHIKAQEQTLLDAEIERNALQERLGLF